MNIAFILLILSKIQDVKWCSVNLIRLTLHQASSVEPADFDVEHLASRARGMTNSQPHPRNAGANPLSRPRTSAVSPAGRRLGR